MNSDFKDLLCALNEGGVKYLVVGGYAVIEYTEPRFTMDLDVWVGTDPENAQKVYRALAKFGAPLQDVSPTDFANPENIFQIGVSPVRIDVIMSIPGVLFEEAWERRGYMDFEGTQAPIISRNDLLTNKLAVGRPRDKQDANLLSRADKHPGKR